MTLNQPFNSIASRNYDFNLRAYVIRCLKILNYLYIIFGIHLKFLGRAIFSCYKFELLMARGL